MLCAWAGMGVDASAAVIISNSRIIDGQHHVHDNGHVWFWQPVNMGVRLTVAGMVNPSRRLPAASTAPGRRHHYSISKARPNCSRLRPTMGVRTMTRKVGSVCRGAVVSLVCFGVLADKLPDLGDEFKRRASATRVIRGIGGDLRRTLAGDGLCNWSVTGVKGGVGCLSVVCRLGRSFSLQWVWAFVGDVGCFLGFYKKTSREGQKKGTLKKQPTD